MTENEILRLVRKQIETLPIETLRTICLVQIAQGSGFSPGVTEVSLEERELAIAELKQILGIVAAHRN